MARHASTKRKSSDDTATHDDDGEVVCILDARGGHSEHTMYRVPIPVLPLGMQRKLKENDKRLYLNCNPAEDFIYEFDQEESHSEGEEEEQSYKIVYFFKKALAKYRVVDVEKELKPFRWFLSFSALDYDDQVKLSGNKVLGCDEEKFVRITFVPEGEKPKTYVVPIEKVPSTMREKLESSDRKYYLNMSLDNCEDLDAREFNDNDHDENYNADDIIETINHFFLDYLPDEFRVEPLNRPLQYCEWEIMYSGNYWN